ncbi:MAG: hypothetical protein NTY96_02160 [Bacteroidetes bacterium]|nr:hypothetical protein [Bacteroidota bacterium]
MRKFLLLIFLLLIVTAVVVFSIPALRTIIVNPFLRNQALSMVSPGSTAEQTVYTGEGHQPASKTFTEPGIERIKTDLIGKQIPGWSFDRITEFKQAAITSIARTDLRIDFRLDLQLLSYNGKDETYYNAQVFATYLSGDDDWYLDKVEEIFISFDVTIPPGRWVSISSVPGCSLYPDTKNTLLWTSKSWDYEILSGPGIGEVTLPAVNSYEVKSKAKRPVKTKLTFRPLQ